MQKEKPYWQSTKMRNIAQVHTSFSRFSKKLLSGDLDRRWGSILDLRTAWTWHILTTSECAKNSSLVDHVFPKVWDTTQKENIMTVLKIAVILISYASFCYAFHFIRFARQRSGGTLKQYTGNDQQLLQYSSAVISAQRISLRHHSKRYTYSQALELN